MKKIIVLFLLVCLPANAQEITIDTFAKQITNVTKGKVISQDFAGNCDFLIVQLPEDYDPKLIGFDLQPVLQSVSSSIGKWKQIVSPQDKTISFEIEGKLKKSYTKYSIVYYPFDEYLILIVN